jgi:outer membrane protein, multidrug efflux system
LLARRADIAASRWRVEAAEKNISGARAAFYPDVSIRALAGLQSIEIFKLFQIGSGVPLASAAIHLPIFDGGRLSAQYGASQAQLNAAVANYQDSLVTAAREVAEEASTRTQLIGQRVQRLAAVAAADAVRRSAVARADQGLTDLRPQLVAGNDWIAQRDALLQLDAAALSHDIGLQRALGGGYHQDSNTQVAIHP